MLRKFSVTNFKGFKRKITFDLSAPASYEFNDEIIKNKTITKGIIYGRNGSGKSNLGLALFDIVIHMTDRERVYSKYSLYLNLDSNKKEADFEYVFDFDGTEVVYQYSKTDAASLVKEVLLINGQEVLNFDFSRKTGYTNLKGAETLQLFAPIASTEDRLSRVKFIKSNAILQDSVENRAFLAFTSFVDNMLMFYSVEGNGYQGFRVGPDSFTKGIIREGKIKDFELFLRKAGVDFSLVAVDVNGEKELYCQYGKNMVPFAAISSTGTKSLGLFYYWYLKMSKTSFVYIDEYDAFYHFELSQNIIEMMKELTDTQVFVSTHNTDLISNDILRPDAYYQIIDNRITSFEKSTQKELRKAHNIQKMFKAGSFNE